MKVLVIDNELSIRESLVSAIRVFCPQIEEIEEADGIESGKEKIHPINPTWFFWMLSLEMAPAWTFYRNYKKLHLMLFS